jgi:hypothetical protein
MGEKTKAFGAGGIVTTFIISLLTAALTWGGTTTLQNDQSVAVLMNSVDTLDKTIQRLDATLNKVSDKYQEDYRNVNKQLIINSTRIDEIDERTRGK